MLNERDYAERVREGKKVEEFIIGELAKMNLEVNGSKIVRFEHASETEDVHEKVDVWAIADDGFYYSIQIKFRESAAGHDLGLALVRPYTGQQALRDMWPDIPVDRDMKTEVDFYACLTKEGTIILTPGKEAKRICLQLLKDFRDDPKGFGNGRVFPRSSPNGLQLRLVTDRGKGYSEGHKKLIAYISPEYMIRHGVAIL